MQGGSIRSPMPCRCVRQALTSNTRLTAPPTSHGSSACSAACSSSPGLSRSPCRGMRALRPSLSASVSASGCRCSANALTLRSINEATACAVSRISSSPQLSCASGALSCTAVSTCSRSSSERNPSRWNAGTNRSAAGSTAACRSNATGALRSMVARRLLKSAVSAPPRTRSPSFPLISSPWASTSSSLSYCPSSLSAVFSPTPGMPGMLSELSPIRPFRSGTWSGRTP